MFVGYTFLNKINFFDALVTLLLLAAFFPFAVGGNIYSIANKALTDLGHPKTNYGLLDTIEHEAKKKRNLRHLNRKY